MSFKKNFLLIYQYFYAFFMSKKFYLLERSIFVDNLIQFTLGGEKMEEKDDVLDNLFDKKEDDNLFNLEDRELKRLDAKLGEVNEKLDKFIAEEIPPQSRDSAREHLREYSNILFSYLHRENQLFYKNGIADGIQILLVSLSM